MCRRNSFAFITGAPTSRRSAKSRQSSSASSPKASSNYAWPAQVNRLISQGGFDLILSIGQVVPHEVIGMANYTKNILIGTGGREGINRSHYLGAVYGMERIMGRAENPVRNVLNYASDHFLRQLPIVYVQTVVGRKADGGLAVRGLFIGDDVECFLAPRNSASRSTSRPSTSRSRRPSSFSIPANSIPHGSATRPSIAPAWPLPMALSSSSWPPVCTSLAKTKESTSSSASTAIAEPLARSKQSRKIQTSAPISAPPHTSSTLRPRAASISPGVPGI